MQCGLCVAAWQLTEVREGDGGFACVPGSHKSNYRPPQHVLSTEDGMGCIRTGCCGTGIRRYLQRGAGTRYASLAAHKPRTSLDLIQMLTRILVVGFTTC